MIHVLNPYQMSTSMLRLATLTFETQMSVLSAITHMATHANPMFVTRDRILSEGQADKAPSTAPVAKVAEPAPAKPKPAARKKTVKKPAAPKSAPKMVATKPVVPEPVAATTPEPKPEAPAASKTYRAPSTPPQMPAASPKSRTRPASKSD